MRGAALVAVLLLVGCGVTSTSSSGISYPVGPSLAELHVRERCGAQDGSCHDRAQAALDEIVGELGAPVDDPSVQSPDDPPAEGRLLITYDSDPPFAWTAEGASGTADRVVVDVTGALRGGQSYAVVGPGLAYEVDAAQAEDLLFALFVLTD
ncbi:MAG: hypothetical protein ACXWWQ_08780 [Candidatus Limnocylindria bacterium]